MRFIDIVHASPEVQTEAVILETGETELHTETGESGGVMSSLGLAPTLFAFQFINFALVGSIIWFLILKPLSKRMTERQRMIEESIDNSKKIHENLQRSELKYQERIDAAKVEASKIIEKAGKEAEQLSLEMKLKAKKEIELLIEQAKRNIKSEREDMVVSIKQMAAEMVVVALEKILSEKITDKKDKELVEEMVGKLK